MSSKGRHKSLLHNSGDNVPHWLMHAAFVADIMPTKHSYETEKSDELDQHVAFIDALYSCACTQHSG